MKKIATVVGLGISGYGAALLLNKKGWRTRVTEESATPEVRERVNRLSKEGDIEFEIGRHTRDFIEDSNLVVTSPGAKNNSRPLIWARELDIPVIDEIELGYRFCPAKVVAVTGTNGKSTTTTLIGGILRGGGYDAVVCGNIGHSFCEKVLSLNRKTVVVLEVSSFQLQRIDEFRPYVSLFLNITQNHLDRHKNFEEYVNAKLNIFKNQKRSDWAIVNYEYKNLKGLYKHIKPRVLYFGGPFTADGVCLKDGAICVSDGAKPKRLFCSDELPLKGEHNLKNYQAAILTGLIFRVEPETMKPALKKFKGLEHRFEFVAEIDGVKFINDSKATTVDAAVCAIRSVDGPIVMIAGGRDKGSDFTVLRNLIAQRVKAMVLIGEAKTKIKTQLLGTIPIYEAKDLNNAVSLGFDLARRGDSVLLSPMCASFDMFKNFEEKGDVFKRGVMALKEKGAGKSCARLPPHRDAKKTAFDGCVYSR